ncbi:hypothetical protein ASA1KI_24420 [Opitutales bacterium ASA1]|uniref:hypothetical protein n=1 Tax=Congregicoccus parvus TaxID=3081749 RepID=UPI002B2D8607|nr:hypothetical protein ASA1KI_24420 [Opitutales bacterium ASA1]
MHRGVARLEVEIPVDTTAIVRLPGIEGLGVTESGQPVETVAGVALLLVEEGAALHLPGSGTYVFVWGFDAERRS